MKKDDLYIANLIALLFVLSIVSIVFAIIANIQVLWISAFMFTYVGVWMIYESRNNSGA